MPDRAGRDQCRRAPGALVDIRPRVAVLGQQRLGGLEQNHAAVAGSTRVANAKTAVAGARGRRKQGRGPARAGIDVGRSVGVGDDHRLRRAEDRGGAVGGGLVECGGAVSVAPGGPGRDQGRDPTAALVDVGNRVGVGGDEFFAGLEEDRRAARRVCLVGGICHPVPSRGPGRDQRDRTCVPFVEIGGAVAVGAGQSLVGLEEDVRAVRRGPAEGRRAIGRERADPGSRDECRGCRLQIPHVEVAEAVAVGTDQLLAGHEEDLGPVGGCPLEEGVNRAVAAGGRAGPGSPGYERRRAGVEVALIDVAGAVGIGRDETFGGEEIDPRTVAGGIEVDRRPGPVSTARSAGFGAGGDEHGGAVAQVSSVDVFGVVGVGGDERLAGGEEGPVAVRGGAGVERFEGVVPPRRPGRDLAGHVAFDRDVIRTLVDVELAVGVARHELVGGREEDDLPIRRPAGEVGGCGDGATRAHGEARAHESREQGNEERQPTTGCGSRVHRLSIGSRSALT